MSPVGRPTAAFFDLDKTIIAKSSTLAFSRPFQAGGLITRGAMLRSAYAQFVYLVGGADHDQMEKMRQFMSDLCAGWDVQTVRAIVADTLHNIVDPLVYDEAVSLIEEHHAAGRDVIIVSTSVTDVTMLEAVGHPHAVNPDKDLRRVAKDRGWPVLVFNKPVALQSRVRLPPAKPTLAALAMGGAVAVGGAIWINLRRRNASA